MAERDAEWYRNYRLRKAQGNTRSYTKVASKVANAAPKVASQMDSDSIADRLLDRYNVTQQSNVAPQVASKVAPQSNVTQHVTQSAKRLTINRAKDPPPDAVKPIDDTPERKRRNRKHWTMQIGIGKWMP
jgi:hypothetical protein